MILTMVPDSRADDVIVKPTASGMSAQKNPDEQNVHVRANITQDRPARREQINNDRIMFS